MRENFTASGESPLLCVGFVLCVGARYINVILYKLIRWLSAKQKVVCVLCTCRTRPLAAMINACAAQGLLSVGAPRTQCTNTKHNIRVLGVSAWRV